MRSREKKGRGGRGRWERSARDEHCSQGHPGVLLTPDTHSGLTNTTHADLRQDPYQKKNAVGNLTKDEVNELHKELDGMFRCVGPQCRKSRGS